MPQECKDLGQDLNLSLLTISRLLLKLVIVTLHCAIMVNEAISTVNVLGPFRPVTKCGQRDAGLAKHAMTVLQREGFAGSAEPRKNKHCLQHLGRKASWGGRETVCPNIEYGKD